MRAPFEYLIAFTPSHPQNSATRKRGVCPVCIGAIYPGAYILYYPGLSLLLCLRGLLCLVFVLGVCGLDSVRVYGLRFSAVRWRFVLVLTFSSWFALYPSICA